jgi:hypothetical protein
MNGNHTEGASELPEQIKEDSPQLCKTVKEKKLE